MSASASLLSRFPDWDQARRLAARPEVLAAVRAAEGTEFQVQRALRQQFPEDLVRGALTLVELRRRAEGKLDRAGELWLERRGLEQATSSAVAAHKAQRFSGRVWDYCCGIGSDAAALSRRGETIAVDLDPAACWRTQRNAAVLGRAESLAVVCADVQRLVDRSGRLHFDPDRRAGSSRAVRLEDYMPSLPFLQQMTREFAGGAIKLSPAANFGGKFTGAEIELVSLHGECKEATVWFGDLAGTDPWRATALPSGATLAGDPLQHVAEQSGLGAWLFDPDPAVVRAGLVDLAAERLGLRRLDAAEEYLTGDVPLDAPWVQAFEVVAELPNSPREIRAYFRTAGVGTLEIKCRHIPIQAETVRRQLALEGHAAATLVFARIEGKARAIVCRRPPRETALDDGPAEG